jgi:hypothetical protein
VNTNQQRITDPAPAPIFLSYLMHFRNFVLKVQYMVTKNDVGREGHSTLIQVLYGIVAIGGYIKFENVISL